MKKKLTDDSFFAENKHFKYDNEYDLNPDEVETLKKTPSHSKDRMVKDIMAGKDEDFLAKMDTEESGRQYVAEKEEAKKQKQVDQTLEIADRLDMSKKSFSSYRVNVAEYGMWLLIKKDFPAGYEYHCIPTKPGHLDVYGKSMETKEGILFVLKDKSGKVYAHGMRLSYKPLVDEKAVRLMATNVENTVDALEHRLINTKQDKVEEIVKKYKSSQNSKDGTIYTGTKNSSS